MSRRLAGTVLSLVVILASPIDGHAVSARIIAAANVTVRERPSAEAPIVARLPLGTEVTEVGDADLDKTWVHVAMPDGKAGWVIANLTRAFDPVLPGRTQEQLIVDRLARKGDGFPASVELVTFIDRIAGSFTDHEARAKIDLYRLKAIQQALAAIPLNGSKREPYASWLARNTDWVVYSEPGGQWLVAHDPIWKVHAARANTPAADGIAWFSVSAGLPGECEGVLPCYLDARNRLEGEYLRHHPNGAHVADAVAAVGKTTTWLSGMRSPKSPDGFVPKTDCKAFVGTVEALKSAVQGASSAPARDATIANLAALRGWCQ